MNCNKVPGNVLEVSAQKSIDDAISDPKRECG